MSAEARCGTRLVAFLGAIVGPLWPAAAEAHLVTSGLGPVYDGISHVMFSPEDLVPVLAIGLVAGLNGPRAGRWALFALTGSWLVGGLAGVLVAQPSASLILTAGSFLALGVLIALDWRLSPAGVGMIAALVGLLHGWFNGAGIAAEGREALGLVGIGSAVFVLAAISSARVVAITATWLRVAVRVAGSWMAATGLLMLGWGLRGS